MKQRISRKNNSGFTLIEILIVLALLFIFTVATIPFGVELYRSRVLEEETQTISAVLKRAQSNSILGKENSSWGVVFFPEEENYVLFKGEDFTEGDSTNQSFKISPGVSVEQVEKVVFEKHTGNPRVYLAE